MKLGGLKLDKNAWIVIGGAASAVAAAVLLSQKSRGGGSAASVDPSSYFGQGAAAASSGLSAGVELGGQALNLAGDVTGILGSAFTEQSRGLTDTLARLTDAVAVAPRTGHDSISAFPTWDVPPPVDRSGYKPLPVVSTPPSTAPAGSSLVPVVSASTGQQIGTAPATIPASDVGSVPASYKPALFLDTGGAAPLAIYTPPAVSL